MKIYCSRNSNELDKFVGKNVWVKVFDKYFDGYKYINIISETDTSYNYYQLFASTVENHRGEFATETMLPVAYNQAVANLYQEKKSVFELYHPVTCYTTEEMFPNTEEY